MIISDREVGKTRVLGSGPEIRRGIKNVFLGNRVSSEIDRNECEEQNDEQSE